MFKKLGNKLMERQLKNLPKEQREAIMIAFEKDPQFFKDMAKEIKKEVKAGKSQQVASMNVMMKHQNKLRELMGVK
jgi:hypothetical protein